jgi:hypothetical protein
MVVPKDEWVGDRGHRPKLAGPYVDSRASTSGFIILPGRVGRGRIEDERTEDRGDWWARVWSIGGRARRRVQSTEYGVRRGGVSECKGANRPEACAKVQRLIQVGIALRAILGKSRQLGWHAVPTLPEAMRTARGAVPTRGDTGRGVKRGCSVGNTTRFEPFYTSILLLISRCANKHCRGN